MVRPKSICIITNGYPTQDDPGYAFIRPVVCGFADSGIDCTVIAPQSISSALVKNKKRRPIKWIDITRKGNSITVFQPLYLSFSTLKIGGRSISTQLRDNAIKKVFRSNQIAPEIIYAHFWENGIVATEVAGNNSKVFVVSGESKIRVKNRYLNSDIEKAIKRINGLICVSSKNLDESNSLNLITDSMKTIVIPNAVDNSLFRRLNRNLLRKELAFNQDAFIVSFVGAFCHRKGVNRVLEAVKNIPEVKLLLIGKGDNVPENKQIIFKGSLPHKEIARYLNASDVFVLPTLAEGCCNAIIEALACGLPVISSNLPFNWDVLNQTNSILVDPMNVDEITVAIKQLMGDDSRRANLSKGALKCASELTMEKRIIKLIDFLNYA